MKEAREGVTKSIADQAADIFRGDSSRIRRFFQAYRPFICPFDTVIEQVPNGSSVLDVGCGAGLFLLLLAAQERISEARGIDIASGAIRAAQQAVERNGFGSRLSFESWHPDSDLPGGDWTVVTSIDVLHHVPQERQRQFVAALCGAVPVGGRLIVKDMVRTPRWRAVANGMHDLIMARQAVCHLDPDQVIPWVEAEGLTSSYFRRENRLWYGHWTTVFIRE